MEDFNALSLTWDNEPRRVERARIVAEEIMNTIPDMGRMIGMEFGCGTGLLSFQLQPSIKQITLIDNSEGMISVLKEKIQKAQIENMTPLCLDLLTEEFEQKFDLIYTLLALHHVQDTDGILKVFSRMLNPSGYLCMIDLDEEDGSFHDPGFDGHNGFNRDFLMKKLEQMGFSDIQWKICYQNKKTFEDGSVRYYPLFLLTGRKV